MRCLIFGGLRYRNLRVCLPEIQNFYVCCYECMNSYTSTKNNPMSLKMIFILRIPTQSNRMPFLKFSGQDSDSQLKYFNQMAGISKVESFSMSLSYRPKQKSVKCIHAKNKANFSTMQLKEPYHPSDCAARHKITTRNLTEGSKIQ